MKLIFLLGNVGAEYRHTRHNVAWDIINTTGLDWSEKNKFHAYIAEQGTGDGKVLFVRPTTYYNEAGAALRAVVDFYKVDSGEVLIIHDDLMLPLGTVRTRIGGRDAGNNGLKSIAQHVGNDIARIRIGIATDQRSVVGDTDFVLSRFTPQEQIIIDRIRPQVTKLIDDFTNESFAVTTHRDESAEQ